MSKKVKIARLLNVTYDDNTGQVFINMEITDPVWRQKILREYPDLEVSLIIEEKED